MTKQEKRFFTVDGKKRSTTINDKTWEAFRQAIARETQSNTDAVNWSEQIRELIQNYVREVEIRAEVEIKDTLTWCRLEKAVDKDPYKLYTNSSDAVRGLIRSYIVETENN